jgi:hypothetical protein
MDRSVLTLLAVNPAQQATRGFKEGGFEIDRGEKASVNLNIPSGVPEVARVARP